jgi:hypothetical protein
MDLKLPLYSLNTDIKTDAKGNSKLTVRDTDGVLKTMLLPAVNVEATLMRPEPIEIWPDEDVDEFIEKEQKNIHFDGHEPVAHDTFPRDLLRKECAEHVKSGLAEWAAFKSTFVKLTTSIVQHYLSRFAAEKVFGTHDPNEDKKMAAVREKTYEKLQKIAARWESLTDSCETHKSALQDEMDYQYKKIRRTLEDIVAMAKTLPKDHPSRVALFSAENIGTRLLSTTEEFQTNLCDFRALNVKMCLDSMKAFLLEVSAQVKDINAQLTRVGITCATLYQRLQQLGKNNIDFIEEQMKNANTTINTIQTLIFRWSDQLNEAEAIPDYVLKWLKLTFYDMESTKNHHKTNMGDIIHRLKHAQARVNHLLQYSRRSSTMNPEAFKSMDPVVMGFSVLHENAIPIDDTASVSTGTGVRDQYDEISASIVKLQSELDQLGVESVTMWSDKRKSSNELVELSKKIDLLKASIHKRLNEAHTAIRQIQMTGQSNIEQQLTLTLKHLNMIIGSTLNAYRKCTESYSQLHALVKDVCNQIVSEFSENMIATASKLEKIDLLQQKRADVAYERERNINHLMQTLSGKLVDLSTYTQSNCSAEVSDLVERLLVCIKSYACHKSLWDSIGHIESLTKHSKTMRELFLKFETRLV